jgi:hypothetical protein
LVARKARASKKKATKVHVNIRPLQRKVRDPNDARLLLQKYKTPVGLGKEAENSGVLQKNAKGVDPLHQGAK